MLWRGLGVYTYTIDLAKFNDDLASLVFVDGRYQRDLLQQQAIKAVNEASEQTKEIFSRLRFDEEWLLDEDPDDDEIEMDSYWYLTALISHLEPHHSIDWWTMSIGDKVLRNAGWGVERIMDLFQGGHDMLAHPAPAWYKNSAFKKVICGRPIRGWWSPEDIEQLHSEFVNAKSYFFREPPLPLDNLDPSLKSYLKNKCARDIYHDILQMLERALEKGHEMFVEFES